MTGLANKSWGKKLFLVTASEYDKLRRSETSPYFENKKSSDYKEQIQNEKIVSDQTKRVHSKDKQKREITELLKPVLSETMSNQNIINKEKIKQILLIIDSLSDVNITNDELVVKNTKFSLDKVVTDLLSSKTDFDYNIEQLLDIFQEGNVNPHLIPNDYLRDRLLAKEKGGSKIEELGEDDKIENVSTFETPSTYDSPMSESPITPSTISSSQAEKKPVIHNLKVSQPNFSSKTKQNSDNRPSRTQTRPKKAQEQARTSASFSPQRKSGRTAASKIPRVKYGKGLNWSKF